jgi:hypothetical protein
VLGEEENIGWLGAQKWREVRQGADGEREMNQLCTTSVTLRQASFMTLSYLYDKQFLGVRFF